MDLSPDSESEFDPHSSDFSDGNDSASPPFKKHRSDQSACSDARSDSEDIASPCMSAESLDSLSEGCPSPDHMSLSDDDQGELSPSAGVSEGQLAFSADLSEHEIDAEEHTSAWRPAEDCGVWSTPWGEQAQVLITNCFINLKRLPGSLCCDIVSRLLPPPNQPPTRNFPDRAAAALLGIGLLAARTVQDQVRDRPADCGAKSVRSVSERVFIRLLMWASGLPRRAPQARRRFP